MGPLMHKSLIAALLPLLLIVCGVAVVTPLVSSANAADMRVESSVDSSRTPGIFINGDIVSGDYAKFKKIADRLPYGVVIMTRTYLKIA